MSKETRTVAVAACLALGTLAVCLVFPASLPALGAVLGSAVIVDVMLR